MSYILGYIKKEVPIVYGNNIFLSDFDNATFSKTTLEIPNKGSNKNYKLSVSGPTTSLTMDLSNSSIVKNAHFNTTGFYANSSHSFQTKYRLFNGTSSYLPAIPFVSYWIKFNQIDYIEISSVNTYGNENRAGDFFVENGKFINAKITNPVAGTTTKTELGNCETNKWYYITMIQATTSASSTDDIVMAYYVDGKKMTTSNHELSSSSGFNIPDLKYNYEIAEIYISDITDDTELRALPDTIQVPKSALIL